MFLSLKKLENKLFQNYLSFLVIMLIIAKSSIFLQAQFLVDGKVWCLHHKSILSSLPENEDLSWKKIVRSNPIKQVKIETV